MKSSDSMIKTVVLAFAGLLGLGCVGILFWGLSQQKELQQASQSLNHSRQQVEELKVSRLSLEAEMEKLRLERNALEERVGSLQAQMTLQGADVERFSSSLQDAKKQIEQLRVERDEFQAQMAILKGERDSAARQLLRLPVLGQENEELKRSITRLRQRLVMLNRDYQQLAAQLESVQAEVPVHPGVINVIGSNQQSMRTVPNTPVSFSHDVTQQAQTVELPPIIVRKNNAGPALPIRAQVVEVNESQQFVVLDKGQSDGVYVGMVFDVLHGEDLVGQVKVVRVRPDISACDVILTHTDGFLQVGDLVVSQGS